MNPVKAERSARVCEPVRVVSEHYAQACALVREALHEINK